MSYINIMVISISILFTLVITSTFYKMLKSAKCTSKNFRNEEIPLGMGLVFIVSQTLVCSLIAILFRSTRAIIFSYIALLVFIGMIGLLDDLIGEKSIKGLKGHIKSLLKGKLTTGGLKAITGVISALIFSLIVSNDTIEVIINVMMISLFTNIINLFDLRPGRAIKAFIVFATILMLLQVSNSYSFIMLSAITTLIVYSPLDIRARAMLGDIGSNSIGITLGMYSAISQSLEIKIVFLVILIALHIISEYYSFTKIIENNKLLKFFDDLGRRREV